MYYITIAWRRPPTSSLTAFSAKTGTPSPALTRSAFPDESSSCDLSLAILRDSAVKAHLQLYIHVFYHDRDVGEFDRPIPFSCRFYKVTVNESSLWFQLCDQMLFNHDPPRCYDCQDCGGPSRCGTMCSALVANNIGGYFVCTTIRKASNLNVALIGNI
ncbi:hypothetical protein BHE74_00022162 [Ensete ventricosum]|nr:hypothetical protein BHE74_00022162 [Ensete ventricosum]